jgi:predicted metal-dependent phosphoesterase TrpH
MFVDFHIHSNFSDGSDTCLQILNKSMENGVSLISITDHNTVTSIKSMKQLANEHPAIIWIPGVELDAKFRDKGYHILGYGISDNTNMSELCEYNQKVQEDYNSRLLECICKEDKRVSMGEYNTYKQPGSRGGWKLLNYLFDKEITGSLLEGTRYYGKYGFNTNSIEFASVNEACKVIRDSGGVPILAHPIENIPYVGAEKSFFNQITTLLNEGVEGVECIYPLHSELLEGDLVQFCLENNLYISGGTDYHGSFFNKQKQKIGGQFVKAEMVIKLLDRMLE